MICQKRWRIRGESGATPAAADQDRRRRPAPGPAGDLRGGFAAEAMGRESPPVEVARDQIPGGSTAGYTPNLEAEWRGAGRGPSGVLFCAKSANFA